MSLKGFLRNAVFLVPVLLGVPSAMADDGACVGGSCGTPAPMGKAGCCWFGCPGPYVHCTPKVPCLKYKCTCGKPVCDLCDMPGYGYYPTCWRPWDQPVNYNCVVPTPTQLVHPPAAMIPYEETLPTPTPMPGSERTPR